MFFRSGALFLALLFVSFSAQARQAETSAPVSTLSQDDLTLPDRESSVLIQAARLDAVKVPSERIPSNVSVISNKEIKSTNPRTLQEAVQFQEGAVLYDDVGNGLDTTFSLRGFNQSSAVTFLVDGVRVNELDGNTPVFPLISMDDISQIQIERGSAAPVYGSSALAGVVNITTGRPSPKLWRLFGGLDVSSHRGIHFFQGVSGTVQDSLTGLGGALEYYFKGGRDVGEGFRGNSEFRITSFDFKTAYVLPEESGKFYINVKHANDMISNPGELTFDQYQASMKQTNKPNDRRAYRNTVVQLGAEKKFWDDKITASLMTDVRLNHLDFINTTTQFGTNTTLVQSKSRTREMTGQISYEDVWDWLKNTTLIGFEVRKTFELATRIAAPGGQVAPTAVTSLDRNGDFFNSALFWNERLGLTDYVDLNVGMRHDRYSLRTMNPKSPVSDYTNRWNKSTVSTGVTLHPVKSADVFFQFSQGFRVPNLSDVNPFAGSTPPETLRPEKSDQYELGARYRFRDLFKLHSSLFLIDMQDEIVNDSTAVSPLNPFGQNINIGKSRRQGIETGLEIHPAREVSFFGTYTWTQSYVRETNIDPFGSQLVDGRDLGQIPRHRLTWGAEVNPLVRLGEPFQGLKFRVDGTFTGAQHPQSFESTSQAWLDGAGGAGHVIKSFTLWNFLASYTFKNQEIYFKINNVFDRRYYSRAVVSEIFVPGTYPAGIDTFVIPGESREYLLGMRWEIE